MTYFALQVQLAPYHDTQDNYIANICSFSLVVTFLCCTVFRMGTLLEPEEIAERMSSEQRSDARIHVELLGPVLLTSVLGGLVLSLVMMVAQIEWERRRRRAEILEATKKRLRYVESDKLVTLPEVAHGCFHILCAIAI